MQTKMNFLVANKSFDWNFILEKYLVVLDTTFLMLNQLLVITINMKVSSVCFFETVFFLIKIVSLCPLLHMFL